ncbi:Snf7-domain-containing protein [Coemansia spiralis]|nr:Snf7-domain-containing protein [Coemansia spiralis]
MESFLAQVPELANPDKRAFLYSDLSQLKIDNPEGYHEAIEFWTQFLLQICQRGLGYRSVDKSKRHAVGESASAPEEEGDVLDRISAQKTDSVAAPVLCISTAKLATRLSFCGDTPTGLDMVVEEMAKRKALVPAAEFFSSTVRRWAGWAIGLVLPSMPGRFVASVVMGSQVPVSMDPSALVVASQIVATAQRVLDTHYSQVACPLTDNLMSVRDFRRRFASVVTKQEKETNEHAEMSTEDASILIKYLADSRCIAVATIDMAVGQSTSTKNAAYADGEATLVKFASSRTERIAAGGPVTEADRGAFQVKSTKSLISRQVDQLETRISALDAEIRQALGRKQKPLAMAKLRLKRHIEENVLSKRVAALENVERILWQLEQASSDIQLMQTFRAGTFALRGLNRQMEEVDADRVFDDWAQEAARAGDIEDVMGDELLAALPDSVGGPGVDEELEVELDALLAQEQQAEGSAEALADAFGGMSIASKERAPEHAPAQQAEEQKQGEEQYPEEEKGECEEKEQEESENEKVALPA